MWESDGSFLALARHRLQQQAEEARAGTGEAPLARKSLCEPGASPFTHAQSTHTRSATPPGVDVGRQQTGLAAVVAASTATAPSAIATSAATAPSVSVAVAAASAAAAAVSASVARRSEADERPNKRRNRWGGVAGAAEQRAAAATRGLALPETQDSAARRQLKVQHEMQLLEQRIRDAAQRDERATGDAADLQNERQVWRSKSLSR